MLTGLAGTWYEAAFFINMYYLHTVSYVGSVTIVSRGASGYGETE